METTRENYINTLSERYKELQQLLLSEMDKVNKLQSNLGFKKFYDITIRAFNANTSAVKYLKKNDINYYDIGVGNSERSLIVAYESYIYALVNDALVEFYQYINEINEISNNIINSNKFKFYNKIGNKFNMKYDFKSNFIESQYHVNKFYEIGDYLSDLEFENDICEAVYRYLPILFNNLNNKYDSVSAVRIFHLQVMRIIYTLNKMGLKNDILKVSNTENEILSDYLVKIKK